MSKWDIKRGLRLRELDGRGKHFIDISFDQNDINAFSDFTQKFPYTTIDALTNTLKKTRTTVRRAMVKEFQSNLALKPAFIGKGIKSGRIEKDFDTISTEVRVASRRLPLIRYAVKPDRPQSTKGIPVAKRKRTTYQISPYGSIFDDTPYDVLNYDGKLFLQYMKSGHLGVFYRDQGRIKEQYAPSLQYFAKREDFQERIKSLAVHRFKENFQTEMEKMTGVR